MAQPTEAIITIATDTTGQDGFTNKEKPDAPVLNKGFSKQSLPYQQLNYLHNNHGAWLEYIVNELIPEQITAAKLAMELKIGTVIEIIGDSTNPATLYGYGTWNAFGAGLTTVGVGSHTDDRSESKTWTDGQTEGAYRHVQSEGEMAAHNHTADAVDDHVHPVNMSTDQANDASGGDKPIMTNSTEPGAAVVNATSIMTTGAGGHTPVINTVGNSLPMRNTQPSIAVYKWKRVS